MLLLLDWHLLAGSSLPHKKRAETCDDVRPLSFHGHGIGPLHLLIIVAAVIIVPFWQRFTKAGYSGSFSLLMLLPPLGA